MRSPRFGGGIGLGGWDGFSGDFVGRRVFETDNLEMVWSVGFTVPSLEQGNHAVSFDESVVKTSAVKLGFDFEIGSGVFHFVVCTGPSE